MNKLFIIGNGFDIAHDLNTRYSDFLLWYLKKSISTLITIGKHDDQIIRLSIKKANLVKEIKSVSEFKVLRNTQAISCNHYHELIFRIIEDYNEKKLWVDIEVEYYKQLVLIYEKFNSSRHGSDVEDAVIRLNNCFYNIKKQLVEYLGSINFSDINIRDEIQIGFKQELSDFDPSKSERILLLNFNYTNTVNKYKYLFENKLFEVINIHGSLSNEIESIIFGYGDQSDIYFEKMGNTSPEFQTNFKYYRYFDCSNFQKVTKFVESGLFDAVIMGHSCGLSDRDILKLIFDHNNCRRIRIYYKDKPDFDLKTKEITKHVSAEKRLHFGGSVIIPFDSCRQLCP